MAKEVSRTFFRSAVNKVQIALMVVKVLRTGLEKSDLFFFVKHALICILLFMVKDDKLRIYNTFNF